MTQRWQGDTHGSGIGSGRDYTAPLSRLREAMQLPDWVAEEPEAHLLPHLEAACERQGSPWRLVSAVANGVVYYVTLEWQRSSTRMRQLTVDFYSLLGVIAESNTHIREEAADAAIEYQVTTGLLDRDGPFKGHGHILQFRLVGPAVEALLRGRV
jgi:hypothetical protein